MPNEKLIIYGIGGLGADKRVFQYLQCQCEFKFIPWLQPNPSESLDAYAQRFKTQIDTNKPFILLGVSFGGILVNELCRFIKPEKIVLISTAQSKQQIPLIFRAFGKLGFLNIIPNLFIKPPLPILNLLFSLKQKEHKQLLNKIIEDTDPAFIKWALIKVLNWKPKYNEIESIIVHGKNDRLIKPPSNLSQIHLMDGGHFIVVQEGQRISTIINESICLA